MLGIIIDTETTGLPKSYEAPTQDTLDDWPHLVSLDELYNRLFDNSFRGAHGALADAMACWECFQELAKRSVM